MVVGNVKFNFFSPLPNTIILPSVFISSSVELEIGFVRDSGFSPFLIVIVGENTLSELL